MSENKEEILISNHYKLIKEISFLTHKLIGKPNIYLNEISKTNQLYRSNLMDIIFRGLRNKHNLTISSSDLKLTDRNMYNLNTFIISGNAEVQTWNNTDAEPITDVLVGHELYRIEIDKFFIKIRKLGKSKDVYSPNSRTYPERIHCSIWSAFELVCEELNVENDYIMKLKDLILYNLGSNNQSTTLGTCISHNGEIVVCNEDHSRVSFKLSAEGHFSYDLNAYYAAVATINSYSDNSKLEEFCKSIDVKHKNMKDCTFNLNIGSYVRTKI